VRRLDVWVISPECMYGCISASSTTGTGNYPISQWRSVCSMPPSTFLQAIRILGLAQHQPRFEATRAGGVRRWLGALDDGAGAGAPPPATRVGLKTPKRLRPTTTRRQSVPDSTPYRGCEHGCVVLPRGPATTTSTYRRASIFEDEADHEAQHQRGCSSGQPAPRMPICSPSAR
jgi:hypothetical protein